MYQSQQNQQNQQFHTANYRGNQAGHDNYLRSDSQSPSSFGTQNVASQYRGNMKTFQPTGLVNSVYGQQNQVQSGYGQMGSQNAAGNYGSFANSALGTGIQNYHTANYRGDQPGHDNYLRSDSMQPSQYGYASVNQQSGGYNAVPANSSFGTSINTGVNNTAAYNQNQFVSPNSFHTANYRGDQPGHDSYLRSDSATTAQSQYGGGANASNYNTNSSFSNLNTNSVGTSGYGSSYGSQYGQVQQQNQQNQQNQQSYGQSQFVAPNSFHTANYRGDQPGHDNYLRSDSVTTAQSQYGISNQAQNNQNTMSSFNTNKF